MKMPLLLLSLFTFFLSSSALAQLKINAQEKVGIGGEPSSTTKLNIESTDRNAVIINNDYTGSADKYGLQVRFDTDGNSRSRGIYSFLKHSSSAFGDLYGFVNYPYSYNGHPTYGVYTKMHPGSGHKTGVYNYLTVSGNGAQAIGNRNWIWTNGDGFTYGIYQLLNGPGKGHWYGSYLDMHGNSSRSAPMFGSYTKQDHRGFHLIYGQYNLINSFSGAGSSAYASRNIVDATGVSTVTPYGVYAEVKGGSNAHAGFFVGNVYVDGVLSQSSDETLKENITEIEGALEIIKRLNPKSYNYRNLEHHGNNPEIKRYGFLAQEVEEVMPELVFDVKHPVTEKIREGSHPEPIEETTDEEGNPIPPKTQEQPTPDIIEESVENIKSINYIDIIPLLVQGMREQQSQINQCCGNQELNDRSSGSSDDIKELKNQLNKVLVDYSELLKQQEKLLERVHALENCTDCTFMDRHQQRYKVYPNPTSSNFTVSNEANENTFKVHMIDATGKLIQTYQSISNKLSVDTSNLSGGVYSLMIFEHGKLISTEKLVVIE